MAKAEVNSIQGDASSVNQVAANPAQVSTNQAAAKPAQDHYSPGGGWGSQVIATHGGGWGQPKTADLNFILKKKEEQISRLTADFNFTLKKKEEQNSCLRSEIKGLQDAAEERDSEIKALTRQRDIAELNARAFQFLAIDVSIDSGY